MKKKFDINIGDYVELLPECYIESDDYSYEDFFGYVIDKKSKYLIVEGIGRGIISKGIVNAFEKKEVPKIFKNNKIMRIRK